MAPIRISMIKVNANTEATGIRIPFGNGEIITSKMLRHYHDLVDHYGISVSQ